MALDTLAAKVRELRESVMNTPMTFGRDHAEAVKKAVDSSQPTEPIENNGDAPVGPEGAKPPFEAMVETAKIALLNRKDPHEAVEELLGEEPEDETPVIRAVEAALQMLEIEEKEQAPEGAEPV